MAGNFTLLHSGRPGLTVPKISKISFLVKIPFLRIRVGLVNRVGSSIGSAGRRGRRKKNLRLRDVLAITLTLSHYSVTTFSTKVNANSIQFDGSLLCCKFVSYYK